jgi:pimeloyl-ACP methyl ester carboxylesterase
MVGLPVTMAEQWIPVRGGEIRVRYRGPSDGAVPVLFVHGAFTNGHLWDGVIAELVRSGRVPDLVAPDLPLGAHHRPLEPDTALTLPAVAEMLVAVLDALGLDRVVVAANDSGGAVAQHLVAAHPSRVLGFLVTPTETAENLPPRYFRFLFPPLRLRLLMWTTCQLLRTHPGRRLPITFGPLVRRRLPADEATRLMGPLWSSAGARRDLRRFLADATDRAVLEAAARRSSGFTGPVDVAWCADDRVFPDHDADRIAAQYPDGRRVADIIDSGSLSPLDRPDEVAARLGDLLARVEAAKDGQRGEGLTS